jgi:thioredoxin 1
MVHQIEDLAEFKKLVINADSSKLVVVDFWATWCGPCLFIAPVFEELSKEFSDVLFFKVDVDKNEETSAAQGIRSGS